MSLLTKLKQFKDLRQQSKEIRATLSAESVSVEAKGLKITMDGNQEVQSVSVAPDLCQPDQQPKLEEAIKQAVTDANRKVQRLMAEKLRQRGDLNIPGLK